MTSDNTICPPWPVAASSASAARGASAPLAFAGPPPVPGAQRAEAAGEQLMHDARPTAAGESGGPAKFYSTGDAVPGGARLHAVYADRVIIDRSGQLESLTLPRLNPNPRASMAPPPAMPSQFAENLRRIAETNPGALAEVIRPQPVFAGGVQRGYRVYPGRNRQQFAQLGLRPGDLILSINGTPLDDPNRWAEIVSTLGSSGRVSVSIERNGQTQDLTLNTAQIALPSPDAPEGAPGGGMDNRHPITPPQ